ncbi:MAG: hypothetical protein RLZZ455_194 [Candidatus Parcubacteria bacterium]|jgi:glycosyltransferase involved in cell wall biosynthesis
MFKRVCIATFSVYEKNERTAINGMIEPLLSFFTPRSQTIDLIDGPHPGSATVLTKFETHNEKNSITSLSYVSKVLSPFLSIQNQNGTQILFKLRDFLSVFEFALKTRKHYDIYIGLESIYTLAGILLKKIGFTHTVVYYVSDYSPKRYKQKILNNFYLWLDRFCCYNADYIWDVSPAMMPARVKAGLIKKRAKPSLVVPNGLFPNQISIIPQHKLEKNSLVFAGTFGEENGTLLAIEAMVIVQKNIPGAKLHFYGGSKILEIQLQKKVALLGLENSIIFHGFIPDAATLSETIKKYMIGLAPYIGIPGSPRWYADATKIRLYMGAGLPTITTQVPPLGKEVEKKNASIVVKDAKENVAEAIIQLLKNKELYSSMRASAIKFAKENTWENSYASALKKMKINDK